MIGENRIRNDPDAPAPIEDRLEEHIEETKKATTDLKTQVLKVATALKVANMSLKAQNEQLQEAKLSPRANNASPLRSPKRSKEDEEPYQPMESNEVAFVLQQHREEMDKIREDNEKLKEQVKSAFAKVKIEMGKVQVSIDKD